MSENKDTLMYISIKLKKMDSMDQWLLRIKLLLLFLAQAIPYATCRKRKNLSISTGCGEQARPNLNSTIIEAFQINKLSGAHHSLLYEPAFVHKKFDELTVAYFKALKTDLYWGDFVCEEFTDESQIAKALEKALADAKKELRHCAFVDINRKTVETIARYQLSFEKFYLGDEWLTDIQQFDLHGKKSKSFRNSLGCAERLKFRMVEVQQNENLDLINKMVAKFASDKRLSFPRIQAGLVRNYLYDPAISRRIWKLLDQKDKLLGAVVICKIGTNDYFMEHGVHDIRYRFLFDWSISQIILKLKGEGGLYMRWGTITHFFSEQEFQENPYLWLIHLFHKFEKVKKFTEYSIAFKRDFQPILKEPKWIAYTEFNAEIMLDIARVVGY